MEKNEIRVAKRCPKCNQRLFDKMSPASGYIEVKCTRCGTVVRVDLALRRARMPACARMDYKLCS